MNQEIIYSNSQASTKPAPIHPDWILEGNPQARNAVLSRSTDGAACTILWECSQGKFMWHYDIDETVHIIAGSVIVHRLGETPRRLGVGDVAFFPKGVVAHWHVEAHVRKIAFCAMAAPRSIIIALKIMRRIKNVKNIFSKKSAIASLMQA